MSATIPSKRPTQTCDVSPIVHSLLKPENKTGNAFRAHHYTKQLTDVAIKRTARRCVSPQRHKGLVL